MKRVLGLCVAIGGLMKRCHDLTTWIEFWPSHIWFIYLLFYGYLCLLYLHETNYIYYIYYTYYVYLWFINMISQLLAACPPHFPSDFFAFPQEPPAAPPPQPAAKSKAAAVAAKSAACGARPKASAGGEWPGGDGDGDGDGWVYNYPITMVYGIYMYL